MNDAEFWKLIDTIDRDALDDGDDEASVEPLIEALTALPPHEIEAFEEHLAHKLYALDGLRYAQAAGRSGNSDDGFLYARCFVVARGREHYESTLADPTRMPTSLDDWCEPLIYVAERAFESSTGETWSFRPSVSCETGSNRAQY